MANKYLCMLLSVTAGKRKRRTFERHVEASQAHETICNDYGTQELGFALIGPKCFKAYRLP